jgi:hypothetical protein
LFVAINPAAAVRLAVIKFLLSIDLG